MMTHRTIEVQLPLCACRDNISDEVAAGIRLFIERVISRLNSLVDDAVGSDERAIREMFNDFITVAAMHREQPWRLKDGDFTDSEVFHLEDKIQEIVQQIEL